MGALRIYLGGVSGMTISLIKLKRDFALCNESRIKAFEALEEILFTGTDCPEGYDREAFLERQLRDCIGIAARVYREEYARVTSYKIPPKEEK